MNGLRPGTLTTCRKTAGLVLVLVIASAVHVGAQPMVSDPTLQVQTVVSTGLSQPTTMEFLAPNDLLVLQKGDGQVKRVVAGVVQPTPVLDVNVNNSSERGLLGIAINTESPPHVFLYYTEAAGADNGTALANRVYRYTWNAALGILESPSLVLDLPVAPGPNHNGGFIMLGPPPPPGPGQVGDGSLLYVVIGDLNRDGQLQNFPGGPVPDDTGVVLRVQQDGSPASGNPFVPYCSVTTSQPCPSGSGCPAGESCLTQVARYVAYGVRNSFGMALDPMTGSLWDTENGPSNFDEVNLILPGFNSGWEQIMGPNSSDPQGLADLFNMPGGASAYSDPEFSWVSTVAPTSIVFPVGSALGAAYDGVALVGDNNTGQLYRFPLNMARDGFDLSSFMELTDLVADNSAERDLVSIGSGFGVVTDMQIGPDGALYVVSLSNGDIYRIAAGTPGATATRTPTRTRTPTPTSTRTLTPTLTAPPTITAAPTSTITPTRTPTPSTTPTTTPSRTPTPTTGATAPIAFDAASNSGTLSNVTTCSWSHSVGSGANRALLVGISLAGNTAVERHVLTVTYNGATLTEIDSIDDASNLQQTSMWVLSAPAAGVHTVAASFAGIISKALCGAMSFTGVDQALPIEAHLSRLQASSTTVTTTISTLTDGAWLADVVTQSGSGTAGMAVLAGQTQGWNAALTTTRAGGGSRKGPISPPGPAMMSWQSNDAKRWAHVVVALRPGGGSPGTPLPTATASPSPSSTATLTSTPIGAPTATRTPTPTPGGAAAIAFDAASNSGVLSNVTSCSWSHTVGAASNRALVVGISLADNVTADRNVIGVTYGGVSLTQVERIDDALNVQQSSVWVLTAPATGAHPVTATFAGSINKALCGAQSFSGVDQATPIDAHVSHLQANATTLTTAITTLTDGAWLADVATEGVSGTSGMMVGTGQVQAWKSALTTTRDAGGSRKGPISPAGSAAMTWKSNDNKQWAHSVVALRPGS